MWELSNEVFSVCCTICCKPCASIDFWLIACKKNSQNSIAWSRMQMQISWSLIWATFLMQLILLMIWHVVTTLLLNACFGILSIIKFVKTVLDYTWLENISKMAAKWTAWTRGRRKSNERMSRTTQSWTRDKCWILSFFLSLRLDRWTLMARLCGKL